VYSHLSYPHLSWFNQPHEILPFSGPPKYQIIVDICIKPYLHSWICIRTPPQKKYYRFPKSWISHWKNIKSLEIIFSKSRILLVKTPFGAPKTKKNNSPRKISRSWQLSPEEPVHTSPGSCQEDSQPGRRDLGSGRMHCDAGCPVMAICCKGKMTRTPPNYGYFKRGWWSLKMMNQWMELFSPLIFAIFQTNSDKCWTYVRKTHEDRLVSWNKLTGKHLEEGKNMIKYGCLVTYEHQPNI